jgi:hypothetical protein
LHPRINKQLSEKTHWLMVRLLNHLTGMLANKDSNLRKIRFERDACLAICQPDKRLFRNGFFVGSSHFTAYALAQFRFKIAILISQHTG